ncbi:hypothetical protein KAS50_00315 [bacterium]|nr:hypothetical protein [bacterium]
MKINTEMLTVSAVYISCAAALGFVFAVVPNVELMTAVIFLGGYIHGSRYGTVIGLFAAFLWSVLNPWGSGLAYPTLLVSQVLGMGVIGFSGGLIRLIVPPVNIGIKGIIVLGLSGFVLTLFYDVITSFGGFLPLGFNWSMIKGVLIAGIPFTLIHVSVNTAIFIVLVPALIKAFRKISLLEKYFYSDRGL